MKAFVCIAGAIALCLIISRISIMLVPPGIATVIMMFAGFIIGRVATRIWLSWRVHT